MNTNGKIFIFIAVIILFLFVYLEWLMIFLTFLVNFVVDGCSAVSAVVFFPDIGGHFNTSLAVTTVSQIS
jgi:hypothetical protein